jgi:flagellar motor component MotA
MVIQKQVKEKITNVKQGWISYLESLEKSLLENIQGQKSKVVENIQKEIFEDSTRHSLQQMSSWLMQKYSNGDSSCFRQDWADIWVLVGFSDISIR